MANGNASFEWRDFQTLQDKLDRLINPDPRPVLQEIESILDNDNRRGILAGLDGYGAPMPLTYRQQNAESRWVTKTLPDGRRVRFKMLGYIEGGDGPALAPHRDASRTIDSYRTAFFTDSPGQWVVIGGWEDVLSKRGVPFLPFHFRGEGVLPTRDLAELRPDGWAEASAAVERWADSLLP